MKAKEIFSKYGIVFVLVVMVLLLCIVSPSFRKPSNLMNVLLQACIFGILALGMTLVIIGKGTDLAVGSTLALCAVVCASFGQKATASGKMYPNLPELPIIIPILAALLIGVVVGLVNGSFIAFTGIQNAQKFGKRCEGSDHSTGTRKCVTLPGFFRFSVHFLYLMNQDRKIIIIITSDIASIFIPSVIM